MNHTHWSMVLGKVLGTLVVGWIGLTAWESVQAEIILTHPNLVSYWMLDEPAGTSGTGSVKDAKSANHGTPAGGVTFGNPSAMSTLGTAAVFNGSSGKIDVPYTADLNPTNFTVELFTRVDGGAGSFRSPLTARADSPQAGFLFYAAGDNTWQFWTGPGWHATTGPGVINNQWVHLAGTYDSGTKIFYINGHPVAQTSNVTYTLNRSSPLRIGAGGSGASVSYWFNGAVDNVAVFNTGLGHQTIADHYNSFSKYATEVLSAEPIAYWRLGEQAGTSAYNAVDVSKYVGTYQSGPVLRQWDDKALAKDIDTSVDFDGSDDRIQVPYASALHPTSLTVSLWAKVEGGENTYRSALTARTAGSGTQGYIIYAGQTNKWEFWTGGGDGDWNHLTGPPVVLNQWTQVVGTYDAATKTKQIFINGQLFGVNSTAKYAPMTAANSLWIGAGGDGGGEFRFNGKLDEVGIYGRPLTRAEIARQYELAVTGTLTENKIFGVTYRYSTPPNGHEDYYRDELKDLGSYSGDLTDLKILGTGYSPDDTSVGWTKTTPVTITFDLGGLYTIHNIQIGYSYDAPFTNDAPDDVRVAFSTDGVNYSTPILFTGFTGTSVHNDLMLDIMNVWATHVQLIFDGGTAHGLDRYLLDEVVIFEGVPEPATWLLLLLGGLGLVLSRSGLIKRFF